MKNYFYLLTILIVSNFGCHAQTSFQSKFLKNGYVIFEEIYGDLNNDGIEDCILIVKGTNKKFFVVNRFGEKVDRNKRGIIVLFKSNDEYNMVIENYACFDSENEDGGVYFPPELSVSIEGGKLFLHYSHGRYGYWKYTFRFQDLDFNLIGYDEGYKSNSISDPISDWVTFDEESINFLSKKKLTREVICADENGKETVKEIWENIEVENLIKLSEIKDFYELEMSKY